MPPEFSVRVEEGDEGVRLDVYLVKCFPHMSRTRIQRLIKAGKIMMDGKPANPRTIVTAENVLTGSLQEEAAWDISPQDIPLDVVYEDNHLVIINKQRGLAVHPGAGRPSGTLVNALAARYGSLPESSSEERPGIVHRLDMDTSGLMVIALSNDAMTRLAQMVSDREIERRYLALVWGDPRFERAVVDAAIGRDPKHPEKMAVLPAQGINPSRAAITELEVKERFSGIASLLEAKLQTGRTHQIRVHCTYAGHSLVGDSVYGKGGVERLGDADKLHKQELADMLKRLDGQALHAWKLSFRHPVTEVMLDFEADCPDEMNNVIEFFRSVHKKDRE